MGQIIIPNDISPDLSKILATLCMNIQEEYDISPTILNKLFNKIEFTDAYNFIYHQCYAEMINNINKFKGQFSIKDDVDDGEYEKCGYLITSHQNTYISYCNVHKYLHPHPNLSLTNKDNQYVVNHPFVMKNRNQVVKERYNNVICLMYQDFINKMYNMIKQVFIYILWRSCDQSCVKIGNSALTEVIANMKSDETFFKSKIIYEYTVSNGDKVTNNDTPKVYYIRMFKLHDDPPL